MTSIGNRRKWRNFVVRPGFQLRLALIHIMFVALVFLVLAVVLLSPLYYDIQKPDELWARYASAELLLRLLTRGGVAVLFVAAISAVYHVIFSHRLCGPLVNMGHTFDSLSRGDTTRKVVLRRKDFLKDEADRINGMVEALNTRVLVLKTSQKDLVAIARQLPEGPVEDRLRELLERNQALLDRWIVDPAGDAGSDGKPS